MNYEFTGETKKFYGITLHRIRATKDIKRIGVLAGSIGGWIEKKSNLNGDAWVSDNARVYGTALVSGYALVAGNAQVYGNAIVRSGSQVYGDAEVYGDSEVYGYAKVYDCARISGCAGVTGNADISGNAIVEWLYDYSVFKNTWSSGRFFTYTRSNMMWKVGCFHGTGAELIAKAYEDSDRTGKCYETIVRAQEAIDND